MSKDLERLKDRYRLSSQEVDEISEKIIKSNTIGIEASSNPQVIILGGQPGAGKGALITLASDILGINTVICNADDYRDQHPQYKEIKEDYPQYYPDITADYSLDWNRRLVAYCEANKFNYILETTFSSGQRMNATIKSMCNKGYSVSIMLLSVNNNLSFLSTKLRYEDMRKQTGYGRMVNKAQHDTRYETIVGTHEVVLNAKLYNNIYIYGRSSSQRLKGTTLGLKEISLNGENPLRDYLKERNKHWSEKICDIILQIS